MESRSLLGLFIAAAIPVVMFALWGEYFKEDLRENTEDNGDLDADEVLHERLARVRIAGLVSTVLQLVIFLSTTPIRQQSPLGSVIGLAATLVGLLIQRGIQLQLEGEFLPKSAPSTPANASPPHSLQTSLFWSIAGMLLYFGLLSGSVFTSAILVAVLKLRGAMALATIGAGAVIGYTLALASNFILSSWFFKKLISSEEVQDASTIILLRKWFSESKVIAPEFRRISPDITKSTNAWVTGFPYQFYLPRPTLWMTTPLLANLSNETQRAELEAIIKHEAAHMRLNHLAKRLFLTWTISLVVLITMAASLGLNSYFRSQNIASMIPFFSLVGAFFLLWGSFKKLQLQAHEQELEADRFSVETLGASAIALISALKRADETNQALGRSLPVGFGSHPSTLERIIALQPLAEKESAAIRAAEDPPRQAA